jgi:predicted membrane-bound spermidine synthase
LLAAVFFVSGLTSLVYQVAWQRLLTVHHGVGAVSIALIVSVYMFGLGLGALLGGRVAERSRDPYTLYAFVEAALGTAGLVSFPVFLALGRIAAGSSPAASLVLVSAYLCVPTLLMGITLPLLTTIFARMTGDFVYSVSHLYFINTLGAASGAVLTGYILISLVGLDGCILLAAAIDFLLAVAILRARRRAVQTSGPEQAGRPAPEATFSLGRLAYILVFATGFIAIGYEIIWYRVIGVLVKDSPYAFSTVLPVYLVGIALGSLSVHRYLARKPATSRRDLFFSIQFLIALTVLLTFTCYYYLSQHGPVQWLTRLSFSTDLHPSLALFRRSPGLHSFADAYLLVDALLWPLALIFVSTVLMGASFPLISSLALSGRGREGRAVGTTYFFGVLGNVLGGLLTGLVLLPVAGTATAVLALGSLGLLFGLAPQTLNGRRLPFLFRSGGVLLLLIGSAAVFPRSGELYAAMHVPPFTPQIVHFEEGLDAVVLTYENADRLSNFINGQGHGYRPGPFFLAEAIEGLSLTPSPRKVLIIGFGAGSITEAALALTEVQQVTVIELCGSAIANLRKFPRIASLLSDKRVRVVIDDGRRFLQGNTEQFDVILMDPLRTTTAYSNNLHSRQFFALAGKHLTAGGILMVGGLDDCPVVPRTLLEAFWHVRAYPGFCTASQLPFRPNPERRGRLLRSFPEDIQRQIRAATPYVLEGRELIEAIAGYPVNEDWRPVSEYYLGLELRQWLRR